MLTFAFFFLLSLDIFTLVYLMFDLSRGYANLGHSWPRRNRHCLQGIKAQVNLDG